jgi:DNA polymerase
VGAGSRQASWLIIGEAPGEQEDLQGEPFVGRAGVLLNNMLKAVGLDRTAVYIANMVKCRPPGNRDPQPMEVSTCYPYLQRQIALMQPDLILLMGRIAAQNLLKTDTAVGRLRGKVHYLADSKMPMVVTYHPAYLLRRPSEKQKTWEDLKLAMETASA